MKVFCLVLLAILGLAAGSSQYVRYSLPNTALLNQPGFASPNPGQPAKDQTQRFQRQTIPISVNPASHIIPRGVKRGEDVIRVARHAVQERELVKDRKQFFGDGRKEDGNNEIDVDGSDVKGRNSDDVDFSNAVQGEDGSWCVTKEKWIEHIEQDEKKDCWHQTVEHCYDTVVTEYRNAEEEECEEVFYKNCKIEFQEQPFNHTTEFCHTPAVEKCDEVYDLHSRHDIRKVCKKWFESFCNTTYDQDWKPSTRCYKKPKEICAPDNCRVVEGEKQCHQKVMTSTTLKPVEICDIQPHRQCRTISVPVPHLKTVPVCRSQPEEVCNTKLVNPHPVYKKILQSWCTKTKPSPKYQTNKVNLKNEEVKSTPQYKEEQQTYKKLPPPPHYGLYSRNG